tara:strand:+ start:134719 stop:134970 length:252 start_codon:yes stop_codon:yes gene_type:complete
MSTKRKETTMTGAEKIKKIMEIINSGKTVQFRSGLSCINVDAKAVSRFEKAGAEMFKASGNSIYIASGRNWKCLNLHAVYTIA